MFSMVMLMVGLMGCFLLALSASALRILEEWRDDWGVLDRLWSFKK